MWRAHLEPRCIPKNGCEILLDLPAVFYFPGCCYQYVSTFLQDGYRFLVQCVRCVYVSLCKFHFVRIYPKVPIVDNITVFQTYFQIQFLGSTDIVQFHVYAAQRE